MQKYGVNSLFKRWETGDWALFNKEKTLLPGVGGVVPTDVSETVCYSTTVKLSLR